MVVSSLGIITLGDFRQKLTRFKGNLKDFFLKMAECRLAKVGHILAVNRGKNSFHENVLLDHRHK